MLSLGLGIWLVDVALALALKNRPGAIPPWGWRLLAIFAPIILGLMLRPLPGGALVLIGVTLTLLLDALPPPPPNHNASKWAFAQALAGYADPSVWLVLTAYFMSRALIKTGLARRIALTFVRLLGGNTLGLSYALVATDTVLAGMIPSNAARVGGVVLPITRSLAELYKSLPGPSASLLGTFLMVVLYQCDVIACALFLTGQASNPLAASQAASLTHNAVQLSYGNWFLYAFAPAAVGLLLAPWVLYRLCKPAITHTPEAAAMAKRELAAMGRPSRGEVLMMVLFAGVCLGWVVVGQRQGAISTTLVAMIGAAVLFLSGILTWDDAISEKGTWDVFIWYGGLLQMGHLLNEASVTTVFAEALAEQLQALPLTLLFLVILLIFFYAHYGFASITTHILAMYPAFVGVLLTLGAPVWLTTCCFAYFSNLSAGLTSYGTTPAPIILGTGYVAHGTWWRIGALMALFNIVVWLGVGLPWWKFWGLW